MFYIRIVNLDSGFYLYMTPEKALEKSEKDKKYLYLQDCLERRCSFTPMVCSTERITGSEALSAQKILASLLSFKMKQKYYGMCVFVR